ncbi:bifunctional demethylmenaquinone methyltransferase/2-methoxy-6-polyprenyl-1,4-benzoquinol methylase [Parafrankia colletiae]|uniref:Demethylmenaquinone methyltransferase n=1 Tax=Parafrankia colletiae TaxID=573497 RepID=A0A1S1QZU3_9ACTN|nr:demethylmenaquinone methyltransferase [Parafrankia colletiae]MCK9899457.1 demethylmenaquinone methyltransferase [Frankia sp. Cpl3]OHV38795.1 bifunctional demethylmenaquinone methyltransferase/2-methoxy-6-polyprenyl-1,4-benzoquinol methylase [Parafrankia colletiae]
MSRAGLDKKPEQVAAMFDQVARRYDVTNAILSAGLDRTWRTATARALDLTPGLRVLDVAAGTATSSRAFAASGADVVACDFSLGMLEVGRHRLAGTSSVGAGTPRVGTGAPRPGRVLLTAGDGLRLPFVDASFDRVTISFGLRNVAAVDVCLGELLRVTRPGGVLAICEFSRPVWGPVRTVYLEYLMRALPAVARGVSSSPDSYVYLAESIRAWPGQAELADLVRGAGWTRVNWRNLSGGIVAVHRAVRPSE